MRVVSVTSLLIALAHTASASTLVTPALRAGPLDGISCTIANVSSLSGYLTLPSDTLVFSILANNHGLEKSQAIAAIDSAVTLVAGAMQGR